MKENPFENYELCSGSMCASKYDCARCMHNVDIDRALNPYVILNAEPCICCSAYLDRPNENYPEKEES